MTVTIDSDIPRQSIQKQEPCMCAQMAEGWSDFYDGNQSDEIRQALAQEANPKCPWCRGTGVETVSHDVGAPTMNLNNRNALILFEILGVKGMGDDGLVGEMTLPQARRAIMRGQARDNLTKFVVPSRREHGKPREIEPGVIDMKPLRLYESGLTIEQLDDYLRRFAEFVIEVGRLGATKIFWS